MKPPCGGFRSEPPPGSRRIVLGDVFGIIYESSYRIMGDNLGGGEQRATD
jgi:hypothetical protein